MFVARAHCHNSAGCDNSDHKDDTKPSPQAWARQRGKLLQVEITGDRRCCAGHDRTVSAGGQQWYQDASEGRWKTKSTARTAAANGKMHLVIDACTLEIRAIEATDNIISDMPVLPALLDRFYGRAHCQHKWQRWPMKRRRPQSDRLAGRASTNPGLVRTSRFGRRMIAIPMRATKRLSRTIWKK